MNCEILKRYRESRNLTQEKMARQLGIAHSGYVCVENGYKESAKLPTNMVQHLPLVTVKIQMKLQMVHMN